MKYIINTGCSYGVLFRSMKEFTKATADIKVIDLHCDSFGSDFQKRTILYTIEHLFGNGVSPENISVICEWSQPNRLFVEAPIEFSTQIIKSDIDTEGAFVLNSNFELEREDKKLLKKYRSIYAIMGDRLYLNPDVDNFNELLNSDLIFYFETLKKNIHISHKLIDRYENYITNILDTQSFLKSNGIDYVFFLMNNVFEGYMEEHSHLYGNSDFLNNEIIKVPDLKNKTQLKDFSSYLTSIWNLIDFDKFVFYKTDRFNYGGIDEYAMEKFGHISYLSIANEWDIPDDGGNVTHFGSHPHDSVYISFFEEYIYPKFKHVFGNMKFDYTNRWDMDKHNSIRN
jgi:hypothetical protein